MGNSCCGRSLGAFEDVNVRSAKAPNYMSFLSPENPMSPSYRLTSYNEADGDVRPPDRSNTVSRED